MKEVAPNVQRIINWRESIATLPDMQFFDLIRMYLGEVHTPFNKTKLVEELGSFLRKEEHRKALVNLLSESDVQLLSAIWFIPNATQEKISAFFAGSNSFAVIYEHLLNLEERLLIYHYTDKKTDKTVISINPMLEETLRPYLTKAALFPPAYLAEPKQTLSQPVSPELLAAFVSFTLSNPDLCKGDGSFKKRAITQIEKLFPGKTELLQLLATACVNLAVFKETDAGFELDMSRLDAFARLDEQTQYAFLCVASQGRFSRTALVRQATLLLELVQAIGSRSLTRTSVLRLAFLISEKDNDIPGVAPLGQTSRFAALMQRSYGDSLEMQSRDVVSLVDRMIDSACLLGILSETGTDEQGESLYTQGAAWSAPARPVRAPFPKVLTIDAAFSVTVLPGLPLSALVPLVSCMELTQFDTAATFELTKKAVMRTFDRGVTQEQLLSLFSDFCLYDIPQNLRVSIDDWASVHRSAALYRGYVLRVNPENSAAIEKNRILKTHIAAKIAPGIYLLDVQSDEEASALVSHCGLDFIGRIQTSAKPVEAAAFPRLAISAHDAFAEPEGDECVLHEELAESHRNAMEQALSALHVTPEQKEGLQERIDRKIILTPEQLRGDSVRFECLEAGGMDFAGKLRIIESAMSTNSMLELAYENPHDPTGESIVVVGQPLETEKLDGDVLLRIELIPQHEEKLFSVGKARLVKRIRGSILR